MPAIEMEFEFNQDKTGDKNLKSAKGVTPIYRGVVQAQGNSYKLVNPEFELYCDGYSKWILNVSSKELVIVPNEYPFRVFSGSRNGRQIWVVDLTPVNKKLAYKSISVGIEKDKYFPVMIKYLSKDGSSYIINIVKFEKQNSVHPKEYFQFPSSRLKGLSVNDMR